MSKKPNKDAQFLVIQFETEDKCFEACCDYLPSGSYILDGKCVIMKLNEWEEHKGNLNKENTLIITQPLGLRKI